MILINCGMGATPSQLREGREGYINYQCERERDRDREDTTRAQARA